MKLIKILSVVIIICLSVSSCTTTEPINTEPMNEIKVINVLHRWPPNSGVMGDILVEMLTEFDELHEDIVVKIDSVPSSMYESQLTVRLASDEGPDIYTLWPGGRVESQIRKGDILDITRLWEQNNWNELFTPGVVSGSTHLDGKKYVLPLEYKTNTFWYNKEIFEELGLQTPATWDELLVTARICKEEGYIPFALGGNLTRWMPAFWFDYLLLNTAGSEFRENLMWGNESWESEEVYFVFELWKELIDLGYFNDDIRSIDSKQAIDMVANKKAAMMLQGPWAINDLMDEGLEPNTGFDLFPFPAINEDIDRASQGAILALAINPDSKHIEESKMLLEFFASKKSIEFLSKERSTLGPRKDVGYEIYNEPIGVLLEKLENVTSDSSLHMNYELATLPIMQDAGMSGFLEFIDHPDEYKRICAEIEAIAKETFK